MNATRAALRAGYSASTALNGQLMQLPKIRCYLQQRTGEVSRKARINQEMVLAELGKIAFSNMRNYYHSDGSLKGVHELTDDEAAALWCLKVTDGESGQSAFIRLNNKLSALEKIARHLGFYQAEAAEEREKEYVVIDKEVLTDDDRFDDDSFDEEEEEEEEEWDEYAEETEPDRLFRMEREREHLCYFYPKLNEVLPSGRYMTDEMIKQALQQFTVRKSDEPWWVGEKRAGRDPRLKVGQKVESEENFELEEREKGCELPVAGGELEEDVAEPVRRGGVIDFGTSKKGTCQVPIMMGNSKEYRSW